MVTQEMEDDVIGGGRWSHGKGQMVPCEVTDFPIDSRIWTWEVTDFSTGGRIWTWEVADGMVEITV